MNIYVGNLAVDVSVSDLETLFGKYGQVKSANIIKDKFSGESRGFGFVEMEAKEDGQQAVSELNGQDLKEQRIKVSEARPRNENRSRRRGGGGGGYGGGGGVYRR